MAMKRQVLVKLLVNPAAFRYSPSASADETNTTLTQVFNNNKYKDKIHQRVWRLEIALLARATRPLRTVEISADGST